MKKNKVAEVFATIIGLLAFLLLAAGTVFVSLDVLKEKGNTQYWLIAIFAVIGLIGGYLCHNLLHETGHLIFAKLAGAKIFEVAFCGFVFTDGEKPKMNLKSGMGGWTSFLLKNPNDSAKTLKLSLCGGLIGSVLSVLIGYVLFQVGKFFGVYQLVSIGGFYNAVNLYLIILNFCSLKNGTDGRLMMNKNSKPNDYFLYKAAELEYQSYLFNGKSAKEIEKLNAKNLTFPTIFDVEKSLQTGDLNSAKAFIESILEKEKIADNGLIDLLLEDLFVAVLTKDVDNIDKKAEKVYGCLLEPDSLLAYRVAIFYRRYTGEIAWGEGLEKTYLRLLEKNPLSGYKKQETEIYNLYRFR